MKRALAIARREVHSSFVTPHAYIVLAGFTLISALFFFSLLKEYNQNLAMAAMRPDFSPSLNLWVVEPYLRSIEFILIFLIPVLSMRSIAEERAHETFEMLMTAPLTVGEIVTGKFLGVSVVVFAALSLSFIFPTVLIIYTDPEIPPILVGMLSTLLLALSLTSLGIAISASTTSQTVAGTIGIVGFLLLYFLDAPLKGYEGTAIEAVRYLAPPRHTEFMRRGLIEGSDLTYFLSIIGFGLFVSSRILEGARWRERV